MKCCDLWVDTKLHISLLTNTDNYKNYNAIYIESFNDNIYENISKIQTSKIIFIKRDYAFNFINSCMQFFQNGIIIMTHNSDYSLDEKYISLLNNDKIKKWYALNAIIRHPKLIAIPLGLANPYHPFGIHLDHGDVNLFDKVCKKNICKTQLLYINFNVDTNKNVRLPIKDLMMKKGFNTEISNLNQFEYWEKLAQHCFAISPFGNGIDCYRIWECIYLHTIPICQKHVAYEQFSHLPILFVDNYDCITKEFLEEKYVEMSTKTYDLSIAKLSYYKNEINKLLNANTIEINKLIHKYKDTNIHIITYGDHQFENNKRKLRVQMNNFKHKFKTAELYDETVLDDEFKIKFKDVLSKKRGAGYWIWKIYIILKKLREIENDEVLIYLDAGCTLNNHGIKRFYEYIDMVKTSKYGMLSFELPFVEDEWTTTKIFEYFNVQNDVNITKSNQLHNTILIMRKCLHSVDVILNAYQALCDDPLLYTDAYNEHHGNSINFKDNRHDQSIFSVIKKKKGCVVITEETWFAPNWNSEASLNSPIWATRFR